MQIIITIIAIIFLIALSCVKLKYNPIDDTVETTFEKWWIKK
jgi:hypothetical protein